MSSSCQCDRVLLLDYLHLGAQYHSRQLLKITETLHARSTGVVGAKTEQNWPIIHVVADASPSIHTTLPANMSAETDPFLALDVSSDDYATTAARDQQAGADATVAAVEAEDDSDAEREKAGAARAARTRYTEDDFLAQKASYTARIDEGSIWKQLLAFEPPFRPSEAFLADVNAGSVDISTSASSSNATSAAGKTQLDKKHHQTIQAAVSELYFLEKYPAVKEIITWAKDNFEKDKKWDVQVAKWETKVDARMQAIKHATALSRPLVIVFWSTSTADGRSCVLRPWAQVPTQTSCKIKMPSADTTRSHAHAFGSERVCRHVCSTLASPMTLHITWTRQFPRLYRHMLVLMGFPVWWALRSLQSCLVGEIGEIGEIECSQRKQASRTHGSGIGLIGLNTRSTLSSSGGLCNRVRFAFVNLVLCQCALQAQLLDKFIDCISNSLSIFLVISRLGDADEGTQASKLRSCRGIGSLEFYYLSQSHARSYAVRNAVRRTKGISKNMADLVIVSSSLGLDLYLGSNSTAWSMARRPVGYRGVLLDVGESAGVSGTQLRLDRLDERRLVCERGAGNDESFGAFVGEAFEQMLGYAIGTVEEVLKVLICVDGEYLGGSGEEEDVVIILLVEDAAGYEPRHDARLNVKFREQPRTTCEEMMLRDKEDMMFNALEVDAWSDNHLDLLRGIAVTGGTVHPERGLLM
ncbi:hypothetical protein KCU83_g605, partial [Aureobasidium melanogenum]